MPNLQILNPLVDVKSVSEDLTQENIHNYTVVCVTGNFYFALYCLHDLAGSWTTALGPESIMTHEQKVTVQRSTILLLLVPRVMHNSRGTLSRFKKLCLAKKAQKWDSQSVFLEVVPGLVTNSELGPF